jgi:hypothetical protein
MDGIWHVAHRSVYVTAPESPRVKAMGRLGMQEEAFLCRRYNRRTQPNAMLAGGNDFGLTRGALGKRGNFGQRKNWD